MAAAVKSLKISESNYPVTLYKYGENSPYVVKAHTHEELTLGCIRGGETVLTLEDNKYSLKAGDIILIPAFTVHLCEPSDPENFSYVILHISPQWILSEFHNKKIKPGIITPDTSLFSRLVTERDNNSIYELFSQIPDLHSKESIPVKKLDRVKDYIDNHFTSDISISDISEKFTLNRYCFIRSFKKQYYLSPHQYIMNQRINRAKELIRRGFSLTDITYDCGFYDQSHFIKTFKVYTGLTPEKFK